MKKEKLKKELVKIFAKKHRKLKQLEKELKIIDEIVKLLEEE